MAGHAIAKHGDHVWSPFSVVPAFGGPMVLTSPNPAAVSAFTIKKSHLQTVFDHGAEDASLA